MSSFLLEPYLCLYRTSRSSLPSASVRQSAPADAHTCTVKHVRHAPHPVETVIVSMNHTKTVNKASIAKAVSPQATCFGLTVPAGVKETFFTIVLQPLADELHCETIQVVIGESDHFQRFESSTDAKKLTRPSVIRFRQEAPGLHSVARHFQFRQALRNPSFAANSLHPLAGNVPRDTRLRHNSLTSSLH